MAACDLPLTLQAPLRRCDGLSYPRLSTVRYGRTPNAQHDCKRYASFRNTSYKYPYFRDCLSKAYITTTTFHGRPVVSAIVHQIPPKRRLKGSLKWPHILWHVRGSSLQLRYHDPGLANSLFCHQVVEVVRSSRCVDMFPTLSSDATCGCLPMSLNFQAADVHLVYVEVVHCWFRLSFRWTVVPHTRDSSVPTADRFRP